MAIKQMFDFGDMKQSAKIGLFNVLCEGINLMSSDFLDTELLESWKKYANSALEMVDHAYHTTYLNDFIITENSFYETSFYPYIFNHQSSFQDSWNFASSQFQPYSTQDKKSCKQKLQRWLIMLVDILKKLP